jgi:hypothetical protein
MSTACEGTTMVLPICDFCPQNADEKDDVFGSQGDYLWNTNPPWSHPEEEIVSSQIPEN